MASRVSTSIGYKGTQTLYYASKNLADWLEKPLNTLVTINFALTSVEPELIVPAFARLRTNHFNKWAQRPNKNSGSSFDPTFLYVFENAKGLIVYDQVGADQPHNIHVHWYVHIPAERAYEFSGRIYEWLDYVAGDLSPSGAIEIQSITKDNGVARYCYKGANKKAAERFGASEIRSPQGAIVGKRSGVSANLGPSARRVLDAERGVDRRARLWWAA